MGHVGTLSLSCLSGQFGYPLAMVDDNRQHVPKPSKDLVTKENIRGYYFLK